MKREFVLTESFDASWDEQRLSDGRLRSLQDELLRNPSVGKVIPGTGGFRKMRFALQGQGKSGGLRVIYLDIPEFSTLYLMLTYPKNVKDNLSPAECNELKKIAESIKRNLRERKGKGNYHA